MADKQKNYLILQNKFFSQPHIASKVTSIFPTSAKNSVQIGFSISNIFQIDFGVVRNESSLSWN